MMGPWRTSASSSSSSSSSATLLLLLLFLTTFWNNSGPVCYAKKKNRNAPHPYRRELTPYQPGPFAIQLSAADEAKLAKGEAVMKQIIPDDPKQQAGSAICVQDVHAPLPAVWYQILDLNNYKDKVRKVHECRNYQVKKQTDGRVTIKTKQVLGVLPGYSYESYYDHTYRPDKSSLTWTLDYDKTSDFRDCVGHWHVTPAKTANHNDDVAVTRVYYACDIKLHGNPPKAIMNYISKAALKQATAWVKKESEAHPEKTIPAEYGGAATARHERRAAIVATKPEDKAHVIMGAGRTTTTTRRGFWGRR